MEIGRKVFPVYDDMEPCVKCALVATGREKPGHRVKFMPASGPTEKHKDGWPDRLVVTCRRCGFVWVRSTKDTQPTRLDEAFVAVDRTGTECEKAMRGEKP